MIANGTKYGRLIVGFGFDCEKDNGNKYSGQIVKIIANDKGTLVTILFEKEGYYTDSEYGYTPQYRSIYLDDCKEWYTSDPTSV